MTTQLWLITQKGITILGSNSVAYEIPERAIGKPRGKIHKSGQAFDLLSNLLMLFEQPLYFGYIPHAQYIWLNSSFFLLVSVSYLPSFYFRNEGIMKAFHLPIFLFPPPIFPPSPILFGSISIYRTCQRKEEKKKMLPKELQLSRLQNKKRHSQDCHLHRQQSTFTPSHLKPKPENRVLRETWI